MISMLERIIYFIIRMIDAAIFIWSMNHSFTKRSKIKGSPIYIFVLLYAVDIAVFTNLFYDVRFLIMTLTMVVAGYLFYIGDNFMITGSCLLMHCVFFSSTLLQILASYAMREREPVYAEAQDLISILLIICSRATLVAIMIGLKDRSIIQLITRKSRMNYLLCAGSIWFGSFILAVALSNNRQKGFFLVLSFASLSAGVVGLAFLLSDMAKNHIELTIESMDIKRTESEIRYLRKLLQGQESVKELRHDLREHLTLISGMAKRGEISRILKYLDTLQELVVETDAINTGNTEIDIMTNNYINEAEESGIVCSVTMCMPVIHNLEFVHVCAIISNMWRNAIEGCISCPPDRRYVIFKMTQSDDGLHISMVNSSADKRKSGLRSFKGGAGHGYGTRSIRHNAERIGGCVEFIPHEDCFEVKLCFPVTVCGDNRMTVSSYRSVSKNNLN